MRTLPILALAPLLCFGCIERTMQIRSEPPGAAVCVDGEEVGKTPVDVPFNSYGKREVYLYFRKEDRPPGAPTFFTHREIVNLEPPLYAIFPIDFFTDALCPFTIRDTKTFNFTLKPVERPDMKEFEARATQAAERFRAILAEEKAKHGLPPSAQPAQH